MMKRLLIVILTGLTLVSVLGSAEAYSVTFDFTGQITTGGGGSNPWSNYDTFYGSYTLEDNTDGRVSRDYTHYDRAITEWDVTFPTFSIAGNVGHISLIDNFAFFSDVSMDRYIVMLYVNESEFPIGFLQFDIKQILRDGIVPDLLSDTSIQKSPIDITLATDRGGRMMTGNGEYYITVDSLSADPVPEPTTIALLGFGLVGIAGVEVRRRRKKKAVVKR